MTKSRKTADLVNALIVDSSNNVTVPQNLIISGTLYAQNTVVVTQSFSSGSNILGDAVDDLQTLYGTVRIPTGSLTVTGSTSVRGTTTVTADGYALTLRGTDNRTLNFRAEGSDAFIDSSGQNFLILRSANGIKLQKTSGTDVNVVLGSDPQSISVSSGTLSFSTQNTNRLTILSGSGYIGINQITPTSQLQVKGSGTTSATTALLVQNANASSSFYVTDTGSAYIRNGLTVQGGPITIGDTQQFYNIRLGGLDQYDSKITLNRMADININVANWASSAITFTRGYNAPLAKIFLTSNFLIGADGTADTGYRLNITGSGTAGTLNAGNTLYVSGSRVGIGISTPSASLHVSGNLLATGGFTGSLSGTASAALTASYVNPLVQDVLITGSLQLSQGFTANGLSTINNRLLINPTLDQGYVLQVEGGTSYFNYITTSGSIEIKGDDTLQQTQNFLIRTGDGTTIADFRNNNFLMLGAGQSGGSASGIVLKYNNTAGPQLSGYNYGNGATPSYKPIFLDVDAGGRNQGVFVNYSASTQPTSTEFAVKGSGTTSATAALRVDDSNLNPSLQVLDNNLVKIGRTSTYTNSSTALIIGHKTNNQYATQLILEPNKDDNTYYKLVLESNYSAANPFSLYSSGNQTWLYGYGNPMFAADPAMKVPTAISMGTTDIAKTEISGSVLFIHGENYWAPAAHVRMTSWSTGVATLRGAVMGLWTGNTLRLWNYENTTVDIGVNNVQRLQVTPSGINVTGSIVTTGNLTLGTYGNLTSGDFAVAGNNSIAVGYSTEARGNGSIVAGFISNTDSGADFNAAIGYEARSYLPGQISFAYGNHTFNNRDAGAQQSFITVKNSSGLTTGATMDLSIAGTNITLLGSSRAWMVTMDWISTVSSISGTATGVTVGDTAGGTIRAVVKKVGGVLSVVGIIANDKAADTSLSAVAMTFVAGGSANLIPRFTGPTFAGGGTVTMKVVGGIKLSETSI